MSVRDTVNCFRWSLREGSTLNVKALVLPMLLLETSPLYQDAKGVLKEKGKGRDRGKVSYWVI